jgi:hypothetical protein
MSPNHLPAVRLTLFAVLSLADLILTRLLLDSSHGLVYESNPIAHAWLISYGWVGLAFFKIALMLVVDAVAVFLYFSRPAAARQILNFACVSVGVVVVYSWVLVGRTDHHPTELITVIASALHGPAL